MDRRVEHESRLSLEEKEPLIPLLRGRYRDPLASRGEDPDAALLWREKSIEDVLLNQLFRPGVDEDPPHFEALLKYRLDEVERQLVTSGDPTCRLIERPVVVAVTLLRPLQDFRDLHGLVLQHLQLRLVVEDYVLPGLLRLVVRLEDDSSVSPHRLDHEADWPVSSMRQLV